MVTGSRAPATSDPPSIADETSKEVGRSGPDSSDADWDKSAAKRMDENIGHRRHGKRAIISSLQFLVADTRLYKRLCPSVRPSVRRSVGWLVRNARVENARNAHFTMLQLSLNVCGCMLVCGKGVWARLGVGCPCPPVRNDIVTPASLVFELLVTCLMLLEINLHAPSKLNKKRTRAYTRQERGKKGEVT